jgi:hypothetical protein
VKLVLAETIVEKWSSMIFFSAHISHSHLPIIIAIVGPDHHIFSTSQAIVFSSSIDPHRHSIYLWLTIVDMPKLLPLNGGDYYLWKYVPSTPASVIAAILWLIISSVLVWRMFKTRTWFCSAFIIGSFSTCIHSLVTTQKISR